MPIRRLIAILLSGLSMTCGCSLFFGPFGEDEPLSGGIELVAAGDVVGSPVITFTGQPSTVIEGTDFPVGLSSPDAVTFYEWYVDDTPILSGAEADSVTVDADLPVGVHKLTVVTTVGGYLFSDSFVFRVVPGE